mmetsp:Transcript_25294/g.34779  ORF Transcript_25294/g.34779 Transcript_25294/m.34779 type:complete len:105 (+) Transcript_25294:478-792(+)
MINKWYMEFLRNTELRGLLSHSRLHNSGRMIASQKRQLEVLQKELEGSKQFIARQLSASQPAIIVMTQSNIRKQYLYPPVNLHIKRAKHLIHTMDFSKSPFTSQ